MDVANSYKPAAASQPGRTPLCRVGDRDHGLLETAKSLFLERGYAQVSMELIARSAGVAVRTIYMHFGGKLGLLSRVIECDAEREHARAAGLWPAHQHCEATLRAIALNLLSHTLSPTSRSLHADAVAARDFPLALTNDAMQCGPWRGLLDRCFASSAWAERFGPVVESDMLSDMFLGCVIGAHARALRAAPGRVFADRELTAMADLVTRRFLALVAAPALAAAL
ncbi:transcriptional regulator, TetR family [Duganella sp. CF517]|uniref:TetR/AcrR family transcriptional regulator n=1 Tax=Duganella sp. CF517 TaxID=1881038 RepID=UPI0008CE7636|nr:TetR/AcrR family transcriptional regulator [Duganella sp. CF517]SEO09702.1 transcriptional regulator, TetR family [Duganella sp. CF517]